MPIPWNTSRIIKKKPKKAARVTECFPVTDRRTDTDTGTRQRRTAGRHDRHRDRHRQIEAGQTDRQAETVRQMIETGRDSQIEIETAQAGSRQTDSAAETTMQLDLTI